MPEIAIVWYFLNIRTDGSSIQLFPHFLIMKILSPLFLVLLLAFVSFGQKSKPVAENFSAVSIDGQTVELSALKGKIVVMTFWTTRCVICAAEAPKLNKLAEDYRNKNVVFLGLTTDNEVKVRDYLKKKPFNFEILPNSFGVLLKFAEKDRNGNLNVGYPTHFLINQKGEIELRTNGYDKTDLLESSINRLLALK